MVENKKLVSKRLWNWNMWFRRGVIASHKINPSSVPKGYVNPYPGSRGMW